MSENYVFSNENMASVAEREIKTGIESGMTGYKNKLVAFEITINNSLQFIKHINLAHHTIDYKDGSVIAFKDDEQGFYTQTQSSRH